MDCPLISCIQKLVLYETKARYYIVGSNQTETAFRVLKIDRTEPRDLHIQDDKHIYSKPQILSLLTTIDSGNRSGGKQKPSTGLTKTLSAYGIVGNTYPAVRDNPVYSKPQILSLLTTIDSGNRNGGKQKPSTGLTKTLSAYGIVGFVRFLEGYYIILITKREKVALVGWHSVYKIEDTVMQYIPNSDVRYTHPDEQKYVKLFQSVDLSSNFYFSYSYDLTHTLQFNMASCSSNLTCSLEPASDELTSEDNDDNNTVSDGKVKFEMGENGGAIKLPTDKVKEEKTDDRSVFGVKMKPEYRFVWNKYLLDKFEKNVHHDWILYIIYGFIAQSNVCVFGKPIYITLVTRRSNEFAGTRFLKRGANNQGGVANELETEQIVHDASVIRLNKGKITSFVQMRGSVPVYWSQDNTKMMAKPPIELDQRDPYFHTAGLHFNNCLKRHGAPLLLLNLIKRREKRRHESLLTAEYKNVKGFLNQFLPPECQMLYIGFDMAHYTKSKSTNVLVRLARISKNCVKQTGFYFHSPTMEENFWQQEQFDGVKGHKTKTGSLQTGLVRTNCVDCLDRTNTAQFAVGRCALAYQLCALGVLSSPEVEFDTDCLKILEEMYEDQGDTVALQYGGSQLVHRIEGYRKIAPWKSHSRDIMQTLSRYFSNTFSDVEKQQATNVFLGLFLPKENQPNIWDLTTDFYLHNKEADQATMPRRSYTSWCEPEVFESLPLPYEEVSKGKNDCIAVKTSPENEKVDSFFEYYKPYELTNMEELYSFGMTHSIRNFMPRSSKIFSPFARRGVLDQSTKENSLLRIVLKASQELNPNISGKDSTASVTSATSEEGSTSSCSSVEGDLDVTSSSSDEEYCEDQSQLFRYSLWANNSNIYGLDLKSAPEDVDIYQRYEDLGISCLDPTLVKKGSPLSVDIPPLNGFSDDCFIVEPPTVSHRSKEMYVSYVRCGAIGATSPSKTNQDIYKDYVRQKYL